MVEQATRRKKKKKKSSLSIEELTLWVSLVAFVLFVGMLAILFLSLPRARRQEIYTPSPRPPAIAQATATRPFVLPPTWTPAPTQELIPTPVGTAVAALAQPTRMYTPRPTSMTGIPASFFGMASPRRADSLSVLDLARIMQGESAGDPEAAYRVGWVAKNRLLHPSYGDTYYVVSSGFFGYRPDLQPTPQFIELARRVIQARYDPTGGCLYALSRSDIAKLGVPPERADVTYGEWFFFRTWPLNS